MSDGDVRHQIRPPRPHIRWPNDLTTNVTVAGFRNAELHTYSDVGHQVSPRELQDLRRWLLRLLPEKLPTP